MWKIRLVKLDEKCSSKLVHAQLIFYDSLYNKCWINKQHCQNEATLISTVLLMRKEGEEDIGTPAQKIREFYKNPFQWLAISSCLCMAECGHDWMWLTGLMSKLSANLYMDVFKREDKASQVVKEWDTMYSNLWKFEWNDILFTSFSFLNN